MNIKLIVVSKTDVPYLQTGIDEYVGRLKHYCDFEFVVIPALKNLGKASAEEVKEREGQLILKQMEKSDVVVLLDEHGKEYGSVEFSEYLQKQMNAGVRNLAFVIGGALAIAINHLVRYLLHKREVNSKTYLIGAICVAVIGLGLVGLSIALMATSKAAATLVLNQFNWGLIVLTLAISLLFGLIFLLPPLFNKKQVVAEA